MVNFNNNSNGASHTEPEIDFDINFGEGTGWTPFEPKMGPVIRPLKMDGYYQVRIDEVRAGHSAAKNGKLSLRMVIQDTDEADVLVYADIPCTGKSTGPNPRANIGSLFQVLLSAGRTPEEINERVSKGDLMKATAIARSLTLEGKNIAYVQIQHRINTRGKSAGQEKTFVRNFVTKAAYEKAKDKGRARWPKELEGAATQQDVGPAMSDTSFDQVLAVS